MDQFSIGFTVPTENGLSVDQRKIPSVIVLKKHTSYYTNYEVGDNMRYKCDSLCIRYMLKECITEDEKYHMCDQPDMYREIGDVIDTLRDHWLRRG